MPGAEQHPNPIIPIPDPTAVTTDNIRREIEQLLDLLEAKQEILKTRLDGLGDVLEERLRRSEELLEERDERYSERFVAQQTAVDRAFIAAEKAVDTALETRERATGDAFAASEKAILKAEISIEKRADATYVALSELTRMLGNLMPRPEAEQRMRDLSDKIEKIDKVASSSVRREEYDARHSALVEQVISANTRIERIEAYSGGAKIENRLDAISSQLNTNSRSIQTGEGKAVGLNAAWGYLIGAIGLLATIVALILRASGKA